jgi:hypothetical protein
MLNGSSVICKTLHLLTGFSISSFVSREARLSVHGTSRQFAATQQFSRFRSETDIQQAAITEPDL